MAAEPHATLARPGAVCTGQSVPGFAGDPVHLGMMAGNRFPRENILSSLKKSRKKNCKINYFHT
jgi:hypothetical protein